MYYPVEVKQNLAEEFGLIFDHDYNQKTVTISWEYRKATEQDACYFHSLYQNIVFGESGSITPSVSNKCS